MINIYVTYGFGSNLSDCYSKVEAESMAAAFDRIAEVTKNKYAFTYTEKDFAGQVERYALTKVELQAQEMRDE